MSVAPAPYNVSLSAASPLFLYTPSRDGDVLTAWNSSYTQSSIWPEGGAAIGPPADGIGFRRTQAGGARVALNFQGSAVYLCFTTGGAGYALSIDNAPAKSTVITSAATHPMCSSYAAAGVDTLLAVEGLLPVGTHSALLQVSANTANEFRFFGGTVSTGVTTNGRVVDDSVIVDDRDAGWTFTPNTGGSVWDRSHNGKTLYNTTLSFDCNYGATVLATYTFTGAGGAVLLGNVWPDAHAFSVTLDDTTVNMDATSSWEDGKAVFYIASGLDPNAQHTITLRDYNSDVPNCSRGRVCCVGLDAIQLLRPGNKALPTGGSGSKPNGTTADDRAGGSSTNVGAIAGGVVGGVLGLIAAVVLVWFFCFRKRRTDGHPARSGNGVLGEADPTLVARPWGVTPAPVQPAPHWGAESHPGSAPFTTSMTSGVLSQDTHWNPAAQPVVPVIPPVVASGDRKDRSGFGVSHAHAQSTSSQPHSMYPQSMYSGPGSPGYAPSASNGSESNFGTTTLGGGQARLAEADLERVLAFVAQRMDANRSQVNLAAAVPAAPAPPVDDHLPEYRA